jgi:hypothetical protein
LATYVELRSWSYLWWISQAMSVTLHSCTAWVCQATGGWARTEEGTQRLLEPVSNTTLNGCGGVPMVMGP